MSHGKGLDAGEKNYPLLSSHVAGKRPQTTQVCSMGTSSKYHPVIKCDIAKSNIYRWLSHQNLHLVRGFSSHVGYRGYDYRFTMVDPPGIEGRSFDSFPPFCPFINISETMDGKFKHLGTQRKRPCFIGGFTRLKQVEARDFVDTCGVMKVESIMWQVASKWPTQQLLKLLVLYSICYLYHLLKANPLTKRPIFEGVCPGVSAGLLTQQRVRQFKRLFFPYFRCVHWIWSWGCAIQSADVFRHKADNFEPENTAVESSIAPAASIHSQLQAERVTWNQRAFWHKSGLSVKALRVLGNH